MQEIVALINQHGYSKDKASSIRMKQMKCRPTLLIAEAHQPYLNIIGGSKLKEEMLTTQAAKNLIILFLVHLVLANADDYPTAAMLKPNLILVYMF